jgi:hypothetical protein
VAGRFGDDPTFGKSARNRRTESLGLSLLLRDQRHQVLPLDLKREVLRRLGVAEAKPQSFDAVRTGSPTELVTGLSLDAEMPGLQLIEMKTTLRPIWDVRLEGFFFGVTESEMSLAERLGDRYLFAFVVLNRLNAYGKEFFVLLTRDQLEARIRSKRVQYQVTLARGIQDLTPPFGIGPGELSPLEDGGIGPSRTLALGSLRRAPPGRGRSRTPN